MSRYILRILRIVGRLRPENLGAIVRQLQPCSHHVTKFDACFPCRGQNVHDSEADTPSLRINDQSSGIALIIDQRIEAVLFSDLKDFHLLLQLVDG